MKNIIIATFILCSLFSFNIAMANEAEAEISEHAAEAKMCEKWFTHKTNKALRKKDKSGKKKMRKAMVKTVLNYFFRPKKLIHPINLDHMEDEVLDERSDYELSTTYSMGKSEIFQNKDYFKSQSKTYKSITARRKKLAKGLRAVLKKSTDLQSCIQNLTNEYDLDKYLKTVEEHEGASRVQKEKENNVFHKKVKKTLKGSDIIESATVGKITDGLSSQHNPIAILVLHSSVDGRMFDSNWDEIPKSTFQNMSSKIKNLILFTCHAEIVIKYYNLIEVAKKNQIQLIYPLITDKLSWLIGDSAPAILFKTYIKRSFKIIKTVNQDHTTGIAPMMSKNCVADLSETSLNFDSLGVYLNQSYIGRMQSDERSVAFNCDLLKANNTISFKAINLYDEPVSSLDQSKSSVVNIRLEDESDIAVSVTDVFYKQKYVGSKGSF